MNDRRLVGLVGRAGVGKDTVADMLYRYGYVKFPFADPLGVMVNVQLRMHGLDDIDWRNCREDKERSLPGLHLSVRQHMQIIGEAMRACDPSYWIRCLAIRAGLRQGDERQADRIVISDVRHPDEARFVRLLGGVLVRIERRTAPVAAHISETSASRIRTDFKIRNTGTLEHLRGQVDAIHARIEAWHA